MLTDPVADMLTRIRNANLAMHDQASMPASKLKIEIAKLLEAEGYLSGWSAQGEGRDHVLTVNLKYDKNRRQVISGLRRVSKPGRRIYVDRDSIPKVLGGMGVHRSSQMSVCRTKPCNGRAWTSTSVPNGTSWPTSRMRCSTMLAPDTKCRFS